MRKGLSWRKYNKKKELKAKEEDITKEFFRKSFLSRGSSSLAWMALALGSRHLATGT